MAYRAKGVTKPLRCEKLQQLSIEDVGDLNVRYVTYMWNK
jgi:hypothetical protein